jgi:phosphoribosylcarboxyaminoimidazole (NCAIR) mutase
MGQGKPGVCVVAGSESDDCVIIESDFAKIMAELGIDWSKSYCSAERHDEELGEYLRSQWKRGVRIFVGVVGWSPRLPAVMAAKLPKSAIVFGVAKLTFGLGSIDPAPTIAVSTPGCPILVCGPDKWGMTNVAFSIGAIMGMIDPDVAERVDQIRRNYRPAPQFDVPY